MAWVAGCRCNGSETMRCLRRAALRAKPPVEPRVEDLFRNELANIVNLRHELVRLSGGDRLGGLRPGVRCAVRLDDGSTGAADPPRGRAAVPGDSVRVRVTADRNDRGGETNGHGQERERAVDPVKRLLKRRQVVEPVIGHVKIDGLLARNGLKGEAGAALHAVMRGAGRALRLVLARSPWRARGAGALLAP